MNYITRKFIALLCLSFMMVLSACGFVSQSSDQRNTVQAGPRQSLDLSEDVINSKLAPPKGFVNKSLFSRQVSSDEERFERLETIVQDLHTSLNEHLPAIKNLTAIESEIQDLVSQLQNLVSAPPEEPPPPAPVETMPSVATQGFSDAMPIKIAPATKAPEKPVSEPTGAIKISDMRVAQTGGKTRVVFDSSQKINYDLDYDDQELIIVISARNATAAKSFAAAASKSGLIKAVDTSSVGPDSTIVISLNRDAAISELKTLTPNAQNAYYRTFFDIVAQ